MRGRSRPKLTTSRKKKPIQKKNKKKRYDLREHLSRSVDCGKHKCLQEFTYFSILKSMRRPCRFYITSADRSSKRFVSMDETKLEYASMTTLTQTTDITSFFFFLVSVKTRLPRGFPSWIPISEVRTCLIHMVFVERVDSASFLRI